MQGAGGRPPAPPGGAPARRSRREAAAPEAAGGAGGATAAQTQVPHPTNYFQEDDPPPSGAPAAPGAGAAGAGSARLPRSATGPELPGRAEVGGSGRMREALGLAEDALQAAEPPAEEEEEEEAAAAGGGGPEAAARRELRSLRRRTAELAGANAHLRRKVARLETNEGRLLVVVESLLHDIKHHGELQADTVEAYDLLEQSGYLDTSDVSE